MCNRGEQRGNDADTPPPRRAEEEAEEEACDVDDDAEDTEEKKGDVQGARVRVRACERPARESDF